MSASKSHKRIAIFGGAFDPPHVGHLLATQYVLGSGLADAVWWLPCWQHRFAKAMTPFRQRLAMCRLALATLPSNKVKLSAFERTFKGDGRSLLLLRALQKRYPRQRFVWMMGSDNYQQRQRWYGFATLQREFGTIIIPRQASTTAAKIAIPNINSSQLRSDWRRHKTAVGMIPAVASYLREEGLYSCKDLR